RRPREATPERNRFASPAVPTPKSTRDPVARGLNDCPTMLTGPHPARSNSDTDPGRILTAADLRGLRSGASPWVGDSNQRPSRRYTSTKVVPTRAHQCDARGAAAQMI